jgi:hypothetical protein
VFQVLECVFISPIDSLKTLGIYDYTKGFDLLNFGILDTEECLLVLVRTYGKGLMVSCDGSHVCP